MIKFVKGVRFDNAAALSEALADQVALYSEIMGIEVVFDEDNVDLPVTVVVTKKADTDFSAEFLSKLTLSKPIEQYFTDQHSYVFSDEEAEQLFCEAFGFTKGFSKDGEIVMNSDESLYLNQVAGNLRDIIDTLDMIDALADEGLTPHVLQLRELLGM